jgi:dipeptidyl aminopeptidase/acylaminoacyl peptidase
VPPDFHEDRRYPLIAYMYPGPQIAHQPQSYRAVNAAPALALAELGFVTFMLDTRGTPVGCRVFHQDGYPELLEPQLADHVEVVKQLCERHAFIDGARIGALGHSAGGAAAARALFDYGEVFKVGVSVCGLHDPELGLATWSDKYRGPRDGNDRSRQANTSVAHKLEGHLLLISGDMDESVHLSQTLLLTDALIAANRDFDLLVVPNAGHLLMMTSGYAQRRVWDYFVRHLLGEAPPRGFEIRFEPHELARFAVRYAQEFA